MTKKSDQPLTRLVAYVPPGLLTQIERIAALDRRSVSQMTVILLEQAVRDNPTPQRLKEGREGK